MRAYHYIATAITIVAAATMAGADWQSNLDGPINFGVTTYNTPSVLDVPSNFSFATAYTVSQFVPTIDFVRVPRLDYTPGVDYPDPMTPAQGKREWSHWGRGLLHSNGNLYFAQGDHMGLEANALLYEYNPATKTGRVLTDTMSAFAPWPDGMPANEVFNLGTPEEPWNVAYGAGKIHQRLEEGPNGQIYFGTMWGEHRNQSEYYFGDRFFSWSPSADTLTHLGRGTLGGEEVLGWGYPSSQSYMKNGYNLMYLESQLKRGANWGDPAQGYRVDEYAAWNTPYINRSIVMNMDTMEVIFSYDRNWAGDVRDSMVDANGNWYFHDDRDTGLLKKYDPVTNTISDFSVALPAGTRIRRTDIDANGIIWIALQGSGGGATQIVRFDPVAETLTHLVDHGYDAASWVVNPQGTFGYYIPGSHGTIAGAPVVQVDLLTGDQTIIAFLADLILDEHGIYLGGSLSGNISECGNVLYFVTHGGLTSTYRWNETSMFAVTIPEPATMSLLLVGGLAVIARRRRRAL